jgi:hypothetical protein
MDVAWTSYFITQRNNTEDHKITWKLTSFVDLKADRVLLETDMSLSLQLETDIFYMHKSLAVMTNDYELTLVLCVADKITFSS